ncbi:MAG: hypothetical protein R3C68_00680 [Myxococcota bacterium]
MNVEAFLSATGGISQDRIEAEGRGESEPVASNETRDGRAKNRRIEVVIHNESEHAEDMAPRQDEHQGKAASGG